MAQLANRVAYRVAGLVWTALYAGLSTGSRSSTSPQRGEMFELNVSAVSGEEAPLLAAA
jgi:hypothetical protein